MQIIGIVQGVSLKIAALEKLTIQSEESKSFLHSTDTIEIEKLIIKAFLDEDDTGEDISNQEDTCTFIKPLTPLATKKLVHV